MFSASDTIVAIATPSGRGGIGVVRLSGPAAHDISVRLLNRNAPLEPRHATFGRIVQASADATPIDHIVATRFVAPHSFTGDDVVELSGHGSPVLLRQILDMAVRAGARLAEPGEFTFRAYLNGRMDLVQAEAVRDLVEAVTPLQARAAMDQLEGTLTGEITRIDGALFDLVARLEASLDFPDEGFHFITRQATVTELEDVRTNLVTLLETGRKGRLIREGTTVVLAGRPNVGKSSLFNALLGSGRAIVTDIPGTTRDLLTERVDIGGMAITLVDTAGLRATADLIEMEGVARAEGARRVAALTLFIVDSSSAITEEDRSLRSSLAERTLVVMNKSDRPRAWEPEEFGMAPGQASAVSAVTGSGLDDLRARIVSELSGEEQIRDTPIITNIRHLGLVEDAVRALDVASQAAEAGATEELILAEMLPAREALEAITGRRTADDVLHHIFSRFCIGK